MSDYFGSIDRHLFNEGRHFRLYELLGAHVQEDRSSTRFSVWAPNATSVSVIHDGNGWTPGRDVLQPIASTGIWTGIAEAGPGTRYKYRIETRNGPLDKADPFAFATERPPATASVVTMLDFSWSDEEQLARREVAAWDNAVSIYEVHLGSFDRHADNSLLSYAELAERIGDHVTNLGFTHVELMPVMEHPYDGSWGYQATGYFAPTARFGRPEDFMGFVDALHGRGIGVIVDWVPSHFATDAFGLGEFDGTHLYEHEDLRRRYHPDWGSYEFNYARREVRAFLISSARFWCDRYHIDGLRVDAVASMLYLDYSRGPGGFEPNRFGGREDLEAISLLQEMNEELHQSFPGVLTIAEESTAWPGVTHPAAHGGLGFSLKWDMGWMHDTLSHMSRDPVHRRFHYNELTFRSLYAYSEKYVLPLSHDEVVHGKSALVTKMPGDDWQRRANLRLLFAYEWFLPGRKLLFMGGELATWHEWSHEKALEWSLLEHPDHAGVTRLVGDLNRCYRQRRALYEQEFVPEGFSWIEADAPADGVLAWRRTALDGTSVIAIANFTPVVRKRRIGFPEPGRWLEILNSDASEYGGSGLGNAGAVETEPIVYGAARDSCELVLPPLALLAFFPERAATSD